MLAAASDKTNLKALVLSIKTSITGLLTQKRSCSPLRVVPVTYKRAYKSPPCLRADGFLTDAHTGPASLSLCLPVSLTLSRLPLSLPLSLSLSPVLSVALSHSLHTVSLKHSSTSSIRLSVPLLPVNVPPSSPLAVSVRLSVCLSVCLSVRLAVCLSACRSVGFSLLCALRYLFVCFFMSLQSAALHLSFTTVLFVGSLSYR